jgi:hypothetical protein
MSAGLILRQSAGTGSSTLLTKAAGNHSIYITPTVNAASLEFTTSKNVDFQALNNSLKKVTDAPTTGLHIVSAPGGSTRNWTYVDPAFSADAIASINMINTEYSHPVEYLYNVTAGNTHLVTTAGSAALSSDDLSFVFFAGTTGSNTRFLVQATDTTGRTASGFCGSNTDGVISLVSTMDGATRNMTNITAAFDKDAIATLKFYRVK